MSQLVIEPGNTVQFTIVTSVAPDAAPTLKVTGLAGTVIASMTSVVSDGTHHFALYTTPTSEGTYLGEWYAVKTFNGSPYPFIVKFPFNVKATAQS